MAEVEAEHALAATVDAAELCSVAEPDHFVSETTLLEEFERARLDAGAREVVAGASRLSIRRTATPIRDNSSAAVRPVGPAPAIKMGSVMISLRL